MPKLIQAYAGVFRQDPGMNGAVACVANAVHFMVGMATAAGMAAVPDPSRIPVLFVAFGTCKSREPIA
jgi:hypothetical protein